MHFLYFRLFEIAQVIKVDGSAGIIMQIAVIKVRVIQGTTVQKYAVGITAKSGVVHVSVQRVGVFRRRGLLAYGGLVEHFIIIIVIISCTTVCVILRVFLGELGEVDFQELFFLFLQVGQFLVQTELFAGDFVQLLIIIIIFLRCIIIIVLIINVVDIGGVIGLVYGFIQQGHI